MTFAVDKNEGFMPRIPDAATSLSWSDPNEIPLKYYQTDCRQFLRS